ncbi:hypothetical protein DVDV_0576 [Desulfovibrio sp. DV]|uniref:hypothetical protein n=1 Tax=Desulfovibrio sp. DV TaxID=1844708 RepID=UPI00094B81DB|nr:hypothetical protein [Desulfovibrio sp. DV]OLN30376.1 hypothetical protein DVDV_0576 [Desulfovibrio sp. DV]
MKRQTMTLFFLLCLTAVSCAPKPVPPDSGLQPKAGSRLVTAADAVFASLDCAQKPLPFILLEQNTLAPNPAKPGTQLLHHIVYAFCPAAGDKADTGLLTRSLSFNGKQVFSDATPDFTLTPGRVAVDAVITVPPEALPGKYVYAVEYVSNAEARKRKLARTLTLDEKLELVLVK